MAANKNMPEAYTIVQIMPGETFMVERCRLAGWIFRRTGENGLRQGEFYGDIAAFSTAKDLEKYISETLRFELKGSEQPRARAK